MEYYGNFLEWVNVIKTTNFGEFENVKLVCLAQSIQETGRGKTAISQQHLNMLGVKYHDFLSDLADSYKYYTDSEPKLPDGSQGFDYFCSFHSLENCTIAWQRWFKYWDHYKDALTKLNDPDAFLQEIAHHYAADGSYYTSVKSHFPEAKELLSTMPTSNIEQKLAELEARIAKLEDTHQPINYMYVNVAKDSQLMVRKSPDVASEIIAKMPNKFKVATYDKINNWYHVKGMIDNVPFDGYSCADFLVKDLPVNNYKIMLNIGHSGTSGASGKNGVTELEANKLTVSACKQELAKYANVSVSIVNQDDNAIGLEGVGKATVDYDLAIAFHYNASDGIEHGTEVLVPPSAPQNIKDFGAVLQKELAAVYKLTERGVKEKSLSVFTGWKNANSKCIFVLSESEFIDDDADVAQMKIKAEKYGIAHAKAICKYLNL